MHPQQKVLPFYPLSIEHLKRKAKQLRNHFQGLSGLQRYQEVAARAMGHANYHVVDRDLKTGDHETVYDEDLGGNELATRTGCQMQALREIPGATLLQIAQFLPTWRLTAKPLPSSNAEQDEEPEILSGTVEELAAHYKFPTFVAGELGVAPTDIVFPITQADLQSGRFRQFVEKLHSFPPYRRRPINDFYQQVVKAFGHADAATMEKASREVTVAGTYLPEVLIELSRVISWRLYVQGAGPLSAGVVAVHRALQLCPVEVARAIPLRKVVTIEGPRNTDRWSRMAVPGLEISEDISDPDKPRCALKPDGSLLVRDYAMRASSLISQLWTPDSGKSAEQLKADLISEAYVPLEDYIEMHGLKVCPAGVEPVTYVQSDNTIVGFGFTCAPANLYLNAIYPPDGESLLKALAALWKRVPVPDGLPFKSLPKALWATTFYESSNLGLSNTVPEKGPMGKPRPAVSDLNPWERLSVTVSHEGLDMEVCVTHLGNEWKRPAQQFATENVVGILGFTVPKQAETTWLNELVPMALDEASCTDIHRVFAACNNYHAKEWGYLATEEGQREYLEILVEFSRNAPLQIPHQLDDWNREQEYFGTVMTLRQRWPLLQELSPELLMTLATWHWKKDEVPRPPSDSDAKLFLTRAVAAGAGISGSRVNFSRRAATLFSVIHLYRLARRSVPQDVFTASVSALVVEALRLYTKLEEIEDFVERADALDLEDFLSNAKNKGGEFITVGGW